MALTREEVQHIAQLARLKLSREEELLYAEQLSNILDYAACLSEIDTSSIPPTATVLSLDAPLREDVIRPCPPREDMLANAPSQKEAMFQVPPIFDV